MKKNVKTSEGVREKKEGMSNIGEGKTVANVTQL